MAFMPEWNKETKCHAGKKVSCNISTHSSMYVLMKAQSVQEELAQIIKKKTLKSWKANNHFFYK